MSYMTFTVLAKLLHIKAGGACVYLKLQVFAPLFSVKTAHELNDIYGRYKFLKTTCRNNNNVKRFLINN